MRLQNITSLPLEYYTPGFVAGGGINRSVNRLNLPLNQLYRANNVEPGAFGYGNIDQLGISKLNSNKIIGAKVVSGIIFKNMHVFVKGGRLFSMPIGGGVESQIGTITLFEPDAKVRFALNRGNAGSGKTEMLFMCDGVNSPLYWTGSGAPVAITAFQAALFGVPNTVRPDKVASFRNRLVWSFPASSEYKNLLIYSQDDDGLNYSASAPASIIDAFAEEIEPGDGGNITAIASIKRNNEPSQAEQLIAFKSNNKAYLSETITLTDTPITTFNRQALDLGAINQESVVNFANDIWVLNKQGIGSLTSATASGGIDALTYQQGIRVNSLITQSAQNSAFNKSFMIHVPARQIIWAFMPESQKTDNLSNGIDYGVGNTPMNMSVCFKYGVTDQAGQIVNHWYTRSGAGWGFPCAWTNGQDLYVGSYFGDVYKVFSGEEYERNPLTPSVRQPITSTVETGDNTITGDIRTRKQLRNITAHWFTEGQLEADLTFYVDEKEIGETYSKTVGTGDAGTTWGRFSWGNALWAATGQKPADMKVSPAGIGTTWRFRAEWKSQRENSEGNMIPNRGSLLGISGDISLGGRILNRK